MASAGAILAGFARLPLSELPAVLQGRRALILAPHPDDESLGCGGLIAASCAAGLAPIVVILTDGSASHPGSITHPPRLLAALRQSEVCRAVRHLGLPADHLHCLRHADTALPKAGAAFARTVADLAEIAQARHCGVVIGPWLNDPHCDHEAGAMIATAVAAATALPLLSYPVWGWLLPPETPVEEPRRGGWRLDISRQLAAKRQAIAAHQSQYGALIGDAPDGFRLPAELLAVFDRPYEVFIG